MRRSRVHGTMLGAAFVLAALGGWTPLALAGGDEREYVDPVGDAVVRRTDTCGCPIGLSPSQNLPDVEEIVISPWQTPTPDTNPYNGWQVGRFGASMVRIDIVLVGVVNPPGPLGLGGLAYNPTEYGPSPLYGFVEIDVDADRDTGGDQPGAAPLHFLGNAARFGSRPFGPMGFRAARSAADLFQPWWHTPQVCLSGADWIVTFCGCFATTVVSKANPSETAFGPGSSWVVQGRFFQRSGAYQYASVWAGGTAPGLYDPVVKLRFQHNVATNRTTVSLVYALDQNGANALGPAAGNISEGVADLIAAAAPQHQISDPLASAVTRRWAGKHVWDATDTTRWRPTFLVGTAYPEEMADGALYMWTDIGAGCREHDVNGDGNIDALDRQAVTEFIEDNDGRPGDADGEFNGQVLLANFGYNFSLYDVDGDGVVGPLDVAALPAPCPADFDHSGELTVQDIFAFLAAWFAGDPRADYNHANGLNAQDVFDYLNAWFSGC